MDAVEFLKSAARELVRLEPTMKRRVMRQIDRLADEPRGPGSVRLRGSDDVWRARVGDYRILYQIEDDRLAVLIVRIAHRRDVYR